MTVNIDPAAAYEKETSVDFEIEITANGPMHDGRIQDCHARVFLIV